MKKKLNVQQCGVRKLSRSLAYWSGEIIDGMDYREIMNLLHNIYTRGLIDTSDEAGVHIPDQDAFTNINTQLIKSTTAVDDIAEDFLQFGYYDLLFNLIDLVIQRKQLLEIGLMRILLNCKGGVLGKETQYLLLAKIQHAIDRFDDEELVTKEVKAKVEEIFD